MIKNLLILVVLVSCFSGCGKYNPSGQYVVTRKLLSEGDILILVREKGYQSNSPFSQQAFWLTIDKKTFDRINIGDEWCEQPKVPVAEQPGCGGR